MKATDLIIGMTLALGTLALATPAAAQQGNTMGDYGTQDRATIKNSAGTPLGQVGANDSPQQIRTKLDEFKQKLDDLEKSSRTASPSASEDVRDSVKSMYSKVLDALGRTEKMERVDVKKQDELRKDINKAFKDLDKDYAKAEEKLAKKAHEK